MCLQVHCFVSLVVTAGSLDATKEQPSAASVELMSSACTALQLSGRGFDSRVRLYC